MPCQKSLISNDRRRCLPNIKVSVCFSVFEYWYYESRPIKRNSLSGEKPPPIVYLSYDDWRCFFPSVLWHCWLGIRKSIQPVKIEMGCWCGYLSVAMCRLFGPADATASLNPIISCLIKSRLVLSFWCWLTDVVVENRALNGCSSSSSSSR